MKYSLFLKLAKEITDEERDNYTLLEAMFKMNRPCIDAVEGDRVMITARGAINKWVALSSLRIDSGGNVYLLKKKYRDKTDTVDTKAPIDDPVDDRPETIEEPDETKPPAFDPATYDPTTFDPINATAEEGRNILIYNEWLKTEGRADEQIVPF